MYVLVLVLLFIYIYFELFPIYDIQEIPNFLSQDECDTLILMSKNRLTPSVMYNGNKDIYNTLDRKSGQTWLNDDEHHVVSSISDRVAKLTGTNKTNQESLQLVNYSQNGFFKPHYDSCNGSKEFCQRMNSPLGPRYITVLIYLNDSYAGGATVFPKIGKTVNPEKGKAVLFYNVTPSGVVIDESLHGGNPVLSGEKWVANKWVRLPSRSNI